MHVTVDFSIPIHPPLSSRDDFNLDSKSMDLLPSRLEVCLTKGNLWIELEIS
jgi:hypothetical protein